MIKISQTIIFLTYFSKIFLFCLIIIMNNNSEASELNKNKHNVIYNLSY